METTEVTATDVTESASEGMSNDADFVAKDTTASKANYESSTESEPAEKEAPKPKEPEAPKTPKKVKVNGREVEVDDSEYALFEKMFGKEAESSLSLHKSAYQKMQEAAQVRKQYEQFMDQLKKDPVSLLKDQVDLRKLSEDYLTKELEYELLTPEQKLERKQQEFEDYKRQLAEKDEQVKQEQAQQYWTQHLDNQLSQVLQTAGLPRNPGMVARIVGYAEQLLDSGIPLQSMPWSDVIGYVRNDYMSDIAELMSAMEGDELIAFLGSNVDKIRKADLARVRGQTKPNGGVPDQPPKQPSAPRPRKQSKLDMDSFFSDFQSKFKD